MLLQKSSLSLFALAAIVNQAAAHSWVESLNIIGPNGTLIGDPGYPRGYVSRMSPGFNDASMVYLIPPDGRSTGLEILPSDLMCKGTQNTTNQTAGFPTLQATPGANIALRYQENGHVTIPDNQPGKPNNRGTVYIYGTSEPSPKDTLLGIYGQWNAAGTGGDRRGKLIATQNFDDGQCYQVNLKPISVARQAQFKIATPSNPEGTNLWCQNDFALPQDLPVGKEYTLYWVWWWPTAAGTTGFPSGKNETYTTCSDISIVAPNGTTTADGTNKAVEAAPIANINSAAVPALLSNLNGASPMATAPASASGVAPHTMLATGPVGTGAVPSVYSMPANTAGSMTTVVIPLTTLMTTVVQGASGTATMATAPPASPSVGASPGSIATLTASSVAPATNTSSCTPSNAQKRSKLFGTKAPSRQSSSFATY
ncbi:hypothetical protein MMC14_002604 [Varicellaria rhodocarpa]|nr:hypothetical protein [Varicellaria rhodocarpa]